MSERVISSMWTFARYTILMSAALVAACTTQSPAKSDAAPPPLPDSVHWFRDSAEQRAVYTETYKAAASAARTLATGLQPKSWGVILDIDETILDNSDYQKTLALTGQHFDPKTWDAWVQERKATALPGARQFIDTVRGELRGQIILVTNRPQSQCEATEDNLRNELIRYERILCDRAGTGDKNGRFQSVIKGESGTPPVNVLIWVGDNIQDFPTLTQAAPGDLSDFGVRYFALPNPLYGSWQRNPPR